MAKYSILKSFYASYAWQAFRLLIIAERGLKCECCHELVLKVKDITVHHKIELTPENVQDTSISLNPANVLIVCHECHNKVHNRFGYKPSKGVYIVFGAPLSGKVAYVQEYAGRGDLVVDMDRLYQAVSLLPSYDKPDNLFSNVRGIHNLLIDNIKTRYGKWHSAWVIGGYADRYKRDKLADDLGAELIFCDVSKDECLRRLEVDEDRRCRQDEWRGYIEKWFAAYTVA
ncbi:MAG: hypothetical protein JL50_03000 [Peptococcaceae bacterium BICA1-7]|nr:MAG: hypothetical protein JL50_03000 [Peptococcaceae bacterium BICA1-7]HBV97767.1 HNH endonuclease [Desulfotomaculum sp.]